MPTGDAWMPQPGDTVYAKLLVDRHDEDREGHRPWWCLDASGCPRAFNTADLLPAIPEPPQREPWDVLREAARIMEERLGQHASEAAYRLAHEMEGEANPRPRLAALAQDNSVDVERVRRALAVLEGRE